MVHAPYAMMETSLKLSEEAELYRLGLCCGYFSVADAVRWADSVLESVAQPDDALIEVSLASREHAVEVARYLEHLSKGADTEARKRDLLALLRRKLVPERSVAERVAQAVFRLGRAADDEEIQRLGDHWDDDLNLVLTGLYDSNGPIVEEMLRELGRYEPSELALKHEP